MPVKIEDISSKEEIVTLHKTLDKLQKDALKLVSDSKNTEHALKRATAIAEKLKTALEFKKGKPLASSIAGRTRCPPGTVYDPVTDGCV